MGLPLDVGVEALYGITVSPRFSPRVLIVNFQIWYGDLFEGAGL